jgi:hypothetical protein
MISLWSRREEEMTKAILGCVLLVLCAMLPAHAQTATVDSLFHIAQQQYDDGRYDASELAALRGVREADAAGLDDLDKLKFHLLLGFIYVARDQRDEALRAFREVLNANPAYDLDPVQTSPKILEVFRAARQDYLLHVASVPAVYRMPQADVRLAASWRSLLLPGWGQFYKKQGTKGAAISAAQVMSLVILAVLQSEVNRTHNDYSRLKAYGDPRLEGSYQDYRHAAQLRNVAGYVALGIYAANYLDALYTPVFHTKKR